MALTARCSSAKKERSVLTNLTELANDNINLELLVLDRTKKVILRTQAII